MQPGSGALQRLYRRESAAAIPHTVYSIVLNGLVRIGYSEMGRTKEGSWAPVYRLVKRIPRGRVITYGQLGRALKLRGGARTAGRAMAACPAGRGIPWHRVVGAGGRLLIREPYASLQRKLLESEGVRLTEMRVDLKRHQRKMKKPK